MKRKLCRILGLLAVSVVLLSVCSVVFASGATFSNVIMTIGADETQRNLTWYSEYNAAGEVRYGKSENGQLPDEYMVAKAIAAKALKPGYYTYKATLACLEENTSYVYCLVVGDTVSELRTFEVYDFGDSFSFAFITDPQTNNATHAAAWTNALDKIKNNFDEVSFLVSGGDQTEDPSNERNYDYFISDHLSSLAIATTIGPPHDGTARYANHYNLPNVSSVYGIGDDGANYFYKYNNVLFMHLNVESTDFDGHIAFVENTLKDNPDCTWNIVVLHYTYITARDRSTVSAIVNGRKELMDDFNRLGIDVVLSGHDHMYTRSKMMLNGTELSGDMVDDETNTVTDPKGTLYLSGIKVSKGNSFGQVEQHDDDQYIAKNLNFPDSKSERTGATIFQVTDTSLVLKSYFLDTDQPEQFDHFTIKKTSTVQPSEDPYYTIKFVADPDASFGDDTDLSMFADRRYTALTPDVPELYLPSGSAGEGELYDWSWAYYELGGNGTEVSEFAYGKQYVAYLVSTVTPISNTLYLASTAVPASYIYTWSDAWAIVQRCPNEAFTLVLNENVTLASGDAATLNLPVNVTLDLNGKTLNTTKLSYLVVFASGSDGSVFRTITSQAGGTMEAGREVVRLNSDSGATITLSFGSESSQPLTVSCKYLTFATSFFKVKSTLNLDIYEGSYTISEGSVVYVRNTNATTTSYNTYTVNVRDAQFKFSGESTGFVRSASTATANYYAGTNSHIEAAGCSFTDTYTANHSSSRPLIREDIWKGTATFTDCDFNGMSIGCDANGTVFSQCGGITIGEGCTFTNSATTFKEDDDFSFVTDKVTAASGCILARTNGTGTVEVVKQADAAYITWHNPVGYSECWKKGTIPVYLGESSFTVGGNTYSLVVNGEIAAASEDTAYSFKSEEGYLYRLNESTDSWQISRDGGESYSDIIYELHTFYGTNLDLGNTLDLNFYFAKNYVTDPESYAVIERTYANGKTDEQILAMDQWSEDGTKNYHVISYPGLAAKEMCDKVSVTIYDSSDTAISETKTDSIRSYAMRVLALEEWESAYTTLVDMLNYGAAAQEYFNYATNDLANKELTEAQKTLATEEVEYNNIYVKPDNYYGTNLDLESRIRLNFYFTGVQEGMTAKVTYTDHLGNSVTDEPVEFKKNNSTYQASVEGLVVADGDTAITCKVYNQDGSEYTSVTDSINSYVFRAKESYPWLENIAKFSASAYDYLHRND